MGRHSGGGSGSRAVADTGVTSSDAGKPQETLRVGAAARAVRPGPGTGCGARCPHVRRL